MSVAFSYKSKKLFILSENDIEIKSQIFYEIDSVKGKEDEILIRIDAS